MLLTLFIRNKISKLISLIRNNKNTIILIISLTIAFILLFYFVGNNENFYKRTIAKITSMTEETSQIVDAKSQSEQIKKQYIKATIMNGIHKGKIIDLENTTSYSQVNDLNLKVNDEVFVTIQENSNNQITSSTIIDLKRDKYLFYIVLLFILLILLIGGVKGIRSLTSFIINIIIFSVTINLFLQGYNLIFISIIASLLFIILSISIVCGINKKTLSAIIGTIVGTIISILIAVIVIQINHWNGIHFEEMEFVTHPPEQIFFVEILIGTLGAIMDIAITISSSLQEIYDRNPNIESKMLINSGMSIGRDIMGTMTNTLILVYISGSIPMIILLLKNGLAISYIININLSLELVRALTGSIGVVLSIPITIYTSVILLKKYKIGEI